VGKTLLARECVQLAKRAGLATVQATATRSASTLPFGAFAGVLLENGHGPGAVDDRLDLLRRSAAARVQRAGSRRLVVFVDDAHLLDDASATLVHHLALASDAVVVVTVVTGMPPLDPIIALWRDGLAERLEVGPSAARIRLRRPCSPSRRGPACPRPSGRPRCSPPSG
jgi:hypothetical protein